MMTEEIRFNGNHAEVVNYLRRVPAMLSGSEPDPTGYRDVILNRLGLVMLSIIREAFLVKSGGGTDAAGDKWPPLAESTINSRRRPRGTSTRAGAARRLRWAYSVLAQTGRGVKQLETAKRQAAKAFAFANDVQILRDSGILFASFSYRVGPNYAAVGPGVDYGKYHHTGTRNMPQRRLWPPWERWPDQWKAQLNAVVREGIVEMVAKAASSGFRT